MNKKALYKKQNNNVGLAFFFDKKTDEDWIGK
jgi:hypothetical protein